MAAQGQGQAPTRAYTWQADLSRMLRDAREGIPPDGAWDSEDDDEPDWDDDDDGTAVVLRL